MADKYDWYFLIVGIAKEREYITPFAYIYKDKALKVEREYITPFAYIYKDKALKVKHKILYNYTLPIRNCKYMF
jgi:hypothetical protein